MKKVLIVCIGNVGNEVEALRQTLEYFGCLVLVKYIGRPQNFMDILKGDLPWEADSIIISCHGEDGTIVMPELGEEVYTAEEPKGNSALMFVLRFFYEMLQNEKSVKDAFEIAGVMDAETKLFMMK